MPSPDTPALVIDLDVVEANIAEMAAVAAEAGVGLRPHVKTHKIPMLARIQLDAGASGITCATLGEAEVMAGVGCEDILIAYPLYGEAKLARLRALRERARVRVSLDSVAIAEDLGRLGRRTTPVQVLVEVDTGLHRLGRPPGADTVDLVTRIAEVPGVEVIGLLTHAGHSYRSRDTLAEVAEHEGASMAETARMCAAAGVPIEVVSVGSTPTARIAARVPGVTEVRPGTYVFNDATMMRLGVARRETIGAFVLATVVARPSATRFVVDAGSKCLSSDGVGVPDWIVVADRPDLHLDFLSEEHGVGHVDGGAALPIGTRLELIPSHICAAVNLFDVAYAVRGAGAPRRLTVAARGRAG